MTDEKTLLPEDVLEGAINIIKKMNEANALASRACILNLPSGPKCVMLSPQQCADLKGSYIGGNCP
jgi:hypothetical protein